MLGSQGQKLDDIHDQVRRTNGRVTILETKENRRSAIEEERARVAVDNSPRPAGKKIEVTSTQIITGLVTALGTALAIISQVVGK